MSTVLAMRRSACGIVSVSEDVLSAGVASVSFSAMAVVLAIVDVIAAGMGSGTITAKV